MATLRSGARTTVNEVKEIFHTTDLADDAVIHRINAASFLVDDISDADSSLDTERLTLIEMNVAASGLTTHDPYESKEEHESYSATFDRESSYWQTAVYLDTTGTLANAEGSKPDLRIKTPDAKNIRD